MFRKIGESFIKLFDSIEKRRYKKSIQFFYSPKLDSSRIAKDVIGLTEFDLANFKYEMDGRLEKRFVMLEKYYLQNFIDETKAGKTSYRTYLEDNDIKNDEIPSKISVLIKHLGKNCQLESEIFGSKIMNFFETKTVYNFPLFDMEDKFIASIDFIKPGEEFINIGEYDDKCEYNQWLDFSKIEKGLKELIQKIKKSKLAFASSEQIQNIIDEMLYASTIKRYVLGDFDVRLGNMGLLVKKHRLETAPVFDFETSFQRTHLPEKDLTYLFENHPNVYEKFKNKFNQFLQKDENGETYFERLVNETISNEKDIKDYLMKMDGYVSNISNTIMSIENTNEKCNNILKRFV